jgi:hypothetical protein
MQVWIVNNLMICYECKSDLWLRKMEMKWRCKLTNVFSDFNEIKEKLKTKTNTCLKLDTCQMNAY